MSHSSVFLFTRNTPGIWLEIYFALSKFKTAEYGGVAEGCGKLHLFSMEYSILALSQNHVQHAPFNNHVGKPEEIYVGS